VIISPTPEPTLLQIAPQPCLRARMQWHEATFVATPRAA
jgi:hypothetical protein